MHYNCIRNEIRQKKIDVLKPQTLVPRYFLGIFRRNSDRYLSVRRNFLGIFSFNQANQPRNISRKLKLKNRGNSDGNYPSDPRFYNHEPLLLPHFSLLPLRLLSLLSGDLPLLSRRYLRRILSKPTQIM